MSRVLAAAAVLALAASVGCRTPYDECAETRGLGRCVEFPDGGACTSYRPTCCPETTDPRPACGIDAVLHLDGGPGGCAHVDEPRLHCL